MAKIAGDLMTSGAERVARRDTIVDAAEQLAELDVGAMPIWDEDNRLLVVNGEARGSGRVIPDNAELVCCVAALLGAVGERLQAGDRLIMGSIAQVAVAPGDEVNAEVGGLGRVQITIDP